MNDPVFEPAAQQILQAVVFDMDGTLVASERHGHRVAFNAAFEQEGLADRWPDDLYAELLQVAGGEQRLRHYFTAHRGMSEDRAVELAARLHRRKTAIVSEMAAQGDIPARPGVVRLLRDLSRRGVRLAVATTGRQKWVAPLLQRILDGSPDVRFDCIVTGDDVSALKPDPEAFNVAVRLLGSDPRATLVVEDSGNGVCAAGAAGLRCLAVLSEYGAPHELGGADLIVDGFGDDQHPSRVLANPHGIAARPCVDATLMNDLLLASSA